VVIHGAVQGVGFRPYVHRLAEDHGLAGWVRNNSQGVVIEVEGTQAAVENFLAALPLEKPPHSFIQSLEPSFLDPVGHTGFAILESHGGEKSAVVMPDIATCEDCLREVFDPGNRRYRYPFTNCTHCGPRFSILTALPYDRFNTTMAGFAMCEECQAEYDNPLHRRFHAQPNACPRCGPQIAAWDIGGKPLAHGHAALLLAAASIREGSIVAVKGLGGFHLMANAQTSEAVAILRQRKHREEKPFAVMFPSLGAAREACDMSPMEERLLLSPEAPIVLVRRKTTSGASGCGIVRGVAPGNPYLGVLLPYTPLHHLLMAELGFPIVATSGNLSDEPICIDEHEAVTRLHGIADLFLIHNRQIQRHVDDSVVRVLAGRELVLRRARGYAPLPVRFSSLVPPTLAVGAHLKNVVALASGDQVFISQHIGDLETAEAYAAFKSAAADLQGLYEAPLEHIACDSHPDYLSTGYARESGIPIHSVQHHYAHVLSCMAENEIEGPVLGVAWDGTGYGLDSTIWGGEFLLVGESSFERAAHLRTFPLPGGDAAMKEPRRSAFGLLYELFGEELFDGSIFNVSELGFSNSEVRVLRGMVARGVQCPLCSSAGRLFDAVSALIGQRQVCRFEGQAAMELEWLAETHSTEARYEYGLVEGSPGQSLVVDWGPMVRGVLDDRVRNLSIGEIAARFHNALVDMIAAVAHRFGEERVVLSGGCFQNRVLAEGAIKRLREEGFHPYWHQRVPPNDGGIALGQIAAVSRAFPKNDGQMQ
jgi:hydrogenase maturation protein HypF